MQVEFLRREHREQPLVGDKKLVRQAVEVIGAQEHR